jgi:LacI family transcriptional regulator
MNIRAWRGPTIADIARVSGLGTATVDRVLNGRPGVKDSSRAKVQAAMELLAAGGGGQTPREPRRIGVLTDSGVTFNNSLREAVDRYAGQRPDLVFSFSAVTTSEAKPIQYAQLLERIAEDSDGLIIVAREDVIINRAVRAVTSRGMPVVCITTDLPDSARSFYVGSDQFGAGANAGYLMGRTVPALEGKILLVVSAPYRGQAEREMGFRSTLRSQFAHLDVDERVNSHDEFDFSYQSVAKYIEDHGAPAGIYNVAGGNLGIGRALKDAGADKSVVFIGHELNANSRLLLEGGEMDFVIGHDLDAEVAQSALAVEALLDGRPLPQLGKTPVRIFTKYNCH